MTRTTTAIRRAAAGKVLAAALTAGLVLVAVPAAPAAAAQGGGDPALAVSPGTLPPDRVSTVTVTGSDYLVPPHAPGTDVFGGVYVFFGWVDDPDHFGPSIRNSGNNDGTVGVTYAYPGDAGDAATRDDGSGVTRLVSFTAGGESGDATEFHMDRDGNWSTTLRIFGAEFTMTEPSGETHRYDCREVQCGVFTIGAHGVASATNEQFAPITFSDSAGAADPPPGEPDAATAGPPEAGDEAQTDAPASTPGAGAGPPAAGAPEAGGDDGPLHLDPSSVRSTDGGGAAVLAVAAAAALAALASAGWFWRRRRRNAGGNPPAEHAAGEHPAAPPAGDEPAAPPAGAEPAGSPAGDGRAGSVPPTPEGGTSP